MKIVDFEELSRMEPLVQFIGRLHPMLVHAPIGILIGLVFLEVVFKVRRSALHSQLDHTVRIVGRKDVLKQAVLANGGPVPGVRSFVRKWRSLRESNPSFEIENLAS